MYATKAQYSAGESAAKLDCVVKQMEKKGFTADRAAIEAMVKENIAALHAEKSVTTDIVE